MPERKTTRKFPTEDVQGEGSYVVLRSLTVGEVITLEKSRVKALADSKRPRLVRWFLNLFKRKRTQADVYRDYAYTVIGYVAGWNWVDGEGDPLPDPSEHPEVVERLADVEFSKLVGLIYGGERSEEAKNSKGG